MRYFLEIAYNGKNYNGWQIQPNAPSIQETLTNALSTILRKELHIVGAGRTDAGVHASQLFVHFDVDQELDEELVQKLNSFLPDDIVVKNLFSVDDEAHARFDAISRSYEYRILLGRDPFMLDTTWQLYYQQLDVEMMNNAAAELLNHTNFKSFSKSKTDVKTYNCKVTQAKWILDNNLLTFHISADRFLRNMVRAIVGTLIEVGLGKKTVEDFREIIESEDRSKAGFSVPPQGLFLVKVAYPEKILKNYK
ncbi:MAG: tRNA pseudouridine(38-40) synthase TruA [Flavobacteriaceae bacterium]|nr:tRNA pseudouridine(38-40) synthase TruA [Flavobacteriaceae bacterium]MCB0485462.1 tRNA pseudouridine(38-40) synthase TruA [Flavobacteriaceae bacterium]